MKSQKTNLFFIQILITLFVIASLNNPAVYAEEKSNLPKIANPKVEVNVLDNTIKQETDKEKVAAPKTEIAATSAPVNSPISQPTTAPSANASSMPVTETTPIAVTPIPSASSNASSSAPKATLLPLSTNTPMNMQNNIQEPISTPVAKTTGKPKPLVAGVQTDRIQSSSKPISKSQTVTQKAINKTVTPFAKKLNLSKMAPPQDFITRTFVKNIYTNNAMTPKATNYAIGGSIALIVIGLMLVGESAYKDIKRAKDDKYHPVSETETSTTPWKLSV